MHCKGSPSQRLTHSFSERTSRGTTHHPHTDAHDMFRPCRHGTEVVAVFSDFTPRRTPGRYARLSAPYLAAPHVRAICRFSVAREVDFFFFKQKTAYEILA